MVSSCGNVISLVDRGQTWEIIRDLHNSWHERMPFRCSGLILFQIHFLEYNCSVNAILISIFVSSESTTGL